MTTPTAPPPPGPARPAPTGSDPGPVPNSVSAATARPSLDTSSPTLNTLRFLQRWNVVLPILIVVTGLVGVVGSFVVQSAARSTSERTGPSLIEVQDLFASVAEANTAATAAHLAVDATGAEDRISRNLYFEALRRSQQHLTNVSADIGQADEARTDLQNIGASLASYSGEVEAARLAKLQGLSGADDRLRGALTILTTEIEPSVSAITTFGRAQYDNEAGDGVRLVAISVIVGLIALIAMVWMQVRLAQRTKRILNPLLLLSTLALAALVGLLIFGNAFRLATLVDADSGGYDAIGASSELQASAFGLQSQMALLLLDGSGAEETRIADIDELVAAGQSQIDAIARSGDSNREQAAAATLQVRWLRYLEVVDEVSLRTISGDKQSAVDLFQTDGLTTFNGVNTAIESVLSDNQTQFSDGIQSAAAAVDLNPWLCLLLTAAAGLLSIVAVQRRLGDYR